MDVINFNILKRMLLKHGIYVMQVTAISMEYRGFDMRKDEFKDITILGGHDLDGDVGHIITIGNRRYTLPSTDTMIVQAYLNSLNKEPKTEGES